MLTPYCKPPIRVRAVRDHRDRRKPRWCHQNVLLVLPSSHPTVAIPLPFPPNPPTVGATLVPKHSPFSQSVARARLSGLCRTSNFVEFLLRP
ncbi:hypothetical protein JAAARDRAFT_413993 [Jaapia argillacea MUCL 33604]|uniref:Uncharacterized protein n=1 Tax=Jaapia argillacea MUCL 33604 TaxID=933084 RepID=A0A067PD62_9AGAM|nr:hypothetical protein JAAARDRAFT_413993 [Jaapia argillacea MUCL 33604]